MKIFDIGYQERSFGSKGRNLIEEDWMIIKSSTGSILTKSQTEIIVDTKGCLHTILANGVLDFLFNTCGIDTHSGIMNDFLFFKVIICFALMVLCYNLQYALQDTIYRNSFSKFYSWVTSLLRLMS